MFGSTPGWESSLTEGDHLVGEGGQCEFRGGNSVGRYKVIHLSPHHS